MKLDLRAITAVLLLLAAPAAGATAAPQNANKALHEDLVSRVYRVNHMDTPDAYMLADQICLDRRGDKNSCRWQADRQGWFTYNTDAETQEAIAAALARSDIPAASLTLRLTLLMADNTERPQVRLGKSESAALADIRQLLPYRGYRLVESGQLLAQARGQIRLGGLPHYTAQFSLAKRTGLDASTIQFQDFELHRTFSLSPEAAGKGEQGATMTEVLLRTSFAMQVGETVIVGTSRLDGDDEALIVLLTATR